MTKRLYYHDSTLLEFQAQIIDEIETDRGPACHSLAHAVPACRRSRGPGPGDVPRLPRCQHELIGQQGAHPNGHDRQGR